MAEQDSDGLAGSTVVDLKELTEKYDGLVDSPVTRAEKVWELIQSNLPNLEDWDLLCFCVQYIAMRSMNEMWLERKAIRELNRLIHVAHYTSVAPQLLAKKNKDER